MAKGQMVKAGYLVGEKKFQVRARAALPLLVRQATQASSATVFYSDLAAELGMANERNLNHVLGYIGRGLESLSRDWDEEIPPIQCLVINKRDRLPGEGIGWFGIDKQKFRKLPKREQRRLIDVETRSIIDYSRWTEVLRAFGLAAASRNYAQPVSKAKSNRASRELRTASFGAGGESPQHKRLKNYVAKHPEVVGLPRNIGIGATEEPLKSGDTLDVFFRHGQDHIAVEVKSSLSSDTDIVRGMFQCIKYRHVLEAQQAATGLAQSARSILVLEAKLPPELHSLKNILGVELFDQVVPTR
ncbi:MAG: hypothetical protein WDN23_04660 [Edaphobacter sp.]